MINLHLIRHGEAEVNVRRVVGGMRGDTGLTARGVVQAERLRDRLAATGEINADVVVASTLPRARQTAEIVAPALGASLVLDDELQELNPGDADGLSLEEAIALYGLPDFETDATRPVCPGGESWAGFMNRVGRALDRFSRIYEGRTVVAVTHGGFIDGTFVHYLRLDATTFLPAQFSTRHASLTHWKRRPRPRSPEGYCLVAYNDSTHLRDIDKPARIPWEALGLRPKLV